MGFEGKIYEDLQETRCFGRQLNFGLPVVLGKMCLNMEAMNLDDVVMLEA